MRAVLERDFLREVSRGRSFLVRAMVAGILAAIVLVMAAAEYYDIARNPDKVGSLLFRVAAVSLVALLALWTPPMTVEAILEERQQGTLPLVLAAPVHPFGLALAKVLARTGAVLAGALAAVPVFAVPLLLGGVPWTSVLGLLVTVTAVVLELAAWSVFVSSISKRLATAVVLSFLLPAARWTAWGMLLGHLSAGLPMRGGVPGPLPTHLVATFPGGPVLELARSGAWVQSLRFGNAGRPVPLDSWTGFLLSQPWWGLLAFSLLLTGLLAWLAGRRLAREEEPLKSGLLAALLSPEGRSAPHRPGSRVGASRLPAPAPAGAESPPAGAAAAAPAGPRRRTGSPALLLLRRLLGRGSPGLNPVVWKEARQLNTATSRPLFYTVLAALLGLLVIGVAEGVGRAPYDYLAAEMTLLCLVGCVQGAATFGHERSQGSYDLLRSSPLAPWDIVTGKVTGGAVGLGFLFAVPLGHACLSALEGGAPLLPTTAGLLLCAALPLYWTVQGLSCSAKHDRVRPAMVRALAAFGAAAVALPLLGEAAQAGGILTRDQVDWCQMGSPPATVAGVLEGFGHLWEGGAWDWDDDGPKAISWCLLMAAGAFGHAVIMRFRLAARFEEDRES